MPQALAQRYAQALADSILAPASPLTPEQAITELQSFSALVASSADLHHVLLSPAVSNARKRAVIEQFARQLPLSRLIRNFLFVIVDRRRTGMIGEITEAFQTAVDERLGFIRAQVTSAAPLSREQALRLQDALSQATGRQVRCEFQFDPALIGGVIARVGSKVYDGSVRSQLTAMRQKLVS